MHTALRNKDWKIFAEKYNGPEYAKNKYDQRLRKAYSRFS